MKQGKSTLFTLKQENSLSLLNKRKIHFIHFTKGKSHQFQKVDNVPIPFQ